MNFISKGQIMKGIKNRGSQAHKVKTDYTRKLKHKGLTFERNVCDDGETEDDDEPEPNGTHNQR